MTWRPLRGLGISPPENFSFRQYYSDVYKYAPPPKRAGRAYNRVKDEICKLYKIGPNEGDDTSDGFEEEDDTEREEQTIEQEDTLEVVSSPETDGNSVVDGKDAALEASATAPLSSKIPAVYAEEARKWLATGSKKRTKVTIASNWGPTTWKQKSCQAQRLLLLHDSAETTVSGHLPESSARDKQDKHENAMKDSRMTNGEPANTILVAKDNGGEEKLQLDAADTYFNSESSPNAKRTKPRTRLQKRLAHQSGLDDEQGDEKRHKLSQERNEVGTEARRRTGGRRLPERRRIGGKRLPKKL